VPEEIFYTNGGTVQAAGGTYLRRAADEELLKLCQAGVFAYVLTPRQMGKSSLIINTADQLRQEQEEIRSAIVDLSGFGINLKPEQWYLGLLNEVKEQLMIETDVDTWWREHTRLSFIQRTTRFFEDVVLREVSQPVY
jgi:hypothetical protein